MAHQAAAAPTQAPVVSTQTPTQSTNDLAKVALNIAKAYTDPNPGDIITYAASSLPAGLTKTRPRVSSPAPSTPRPPRLAPIG